METRISEGVRYASNQPEAEYSDNLKLEGSLPDLSLVAPSNLILVEYYNRGLPFIFSASDLDMNK